MRTDLIKDDKHSAWLSAMPYGVKLDTIERLVILYTLELMEGCRSQTARLLGVSVRTITNKLARYKSEGYEVSPPPRPNY